MNPEWVKLCLRPEFAKDWGELATELATERPLDSVSQLQSHHLHTAEPCHQDFHSQYKTLIPAWICFKKHGVSALLCFPTSLCALTHCYTLSPLAYAGLSLLSMA